MKANKFIIQDTIDKGAIPAIKDSISNHDGINAVRVDIQANSITVDYDEGRYSEKQIAGFINQAGLVVDKIQ